MKHYRFALLAALVALPAWSAAPTPAQAQSHQSAARACPSDALPAAERQRLQAEYAERLQRDGRRSADAWSAEQGRQFRARLEAEGVCKPRTGSSTKDTAVKSPKELKNKDGKPCTRTRVANRPAPGFGGAPMTMRMVVVCAD